MGRSYYYLLETGCSCPLGWMIDCCWKHFVGNLSCQSYWLVVISRIHPSYCYSCLPDFQTCFSSSPYCSYFRTDSYCFVQIATTASLDWIVLRTTAAFGFATSCSFLPLGQMVCFAAVAASCQNWSSCFLELNICHLLSEGSSCTFGKDSRCLSRYRLAAIVEAAELFAKSLQNHHQLGLAGWFQNQANWNHRHLELLHFGQEPAR